MFFDKLSIKESINFEQNSLIQSFYADESLGTSRMSPPFLELFRCLISFMAALLLTGLYFLCEKEGPWKMICVPNVILLCLLISLK